MTRANGAGGNADTRSKLHVDVLAASRARLGCPHRKRQNAKSLPSVSAAMCAGTLQLHWERIWEQLMPRHDEHVLVVAVGAKFARALQHEVREWRGGEHKRH